MPVLDIRTREPDGRFPFTVLARASRNKATHNGTYSNVFDLGKWDFLQLMLDVYATSVTDAGDVMDLNVQFSTNGVLYHNVGSFTQQAGNGAAKREILTFKSGLAVDPDAIWIVAAAAGVIDQRSFGRYMRVGIAITDADANAAHQFGITAYIK